jgi:hypothetical protein
MVVVVVVREYFGEEKRLSRVVYRDGRDLERWRWEGEWLFGGKKSGGYFCVSWGVGHGVMARVNPVVPIIHQDNPSLSTVRSWPQVDRRL